MRPGFYIVTRDHVLSGDAPKASYRVKLRRGDWLITDGTVIGRFDKEGELDWLPLEWIRGALVILDDAIEQELDMVAVRIPLSRMEAGFRKLMFVEPGEPLPDMPTPTLAQLEPYLKSRRTLTAHYDYR